GDRGRRGGCEDRLHARGGTVLDHRGAKKRQRIAVGPLELPTTLEHRPIHDPVRAQPAVSPHLVTTVIRAPLPARPQTLVLNSTVMSRPENKTTIVPPL